MGPVKGAVLLKALRPENLPGGLVFGWPILIPKTRDDADGILCTQ